MQRVVPPGPVKEIIAKEYDGNSAGKYHQDSGYVFFCSEESYIEKKIQNKDDVYIPSVLI